LSPATALTWPVAGRLTDLSPAFSSLICHFLSTRVRAPARISRWRQPDFVAVTEGRRMKTLPFGGGREITMSIEGPQGLSPARGYSPPASGLALLPLTVSMLAPSVRSADSRSGLGVACR
jgi:hypothetical protein